MGKLKYSSTSSEQSDDSSLAIISYDDTSDSSSDNVSYEKNASLSTMVCSQCKKNYQGKMTKKSSEDSAAEEKIDKESLCEECSLYFCMDYNVESEMIKLAYKYLSDIKLKVEHKIKLPSKHNKNTLDIYLSRQKQSSNSDNENCPSFEAVDQKKEKNNNYVEMPYNRVACTRDRCCICEKSAKICQNLILKPIPREARVQAFAAKNIFIPKRNRSCAEHLTSDGSAFLNDSLNLLKPFASKSHVDIKELPYFKIHSYKF